MRNLNKIRVESDPRDIVLYTYRTGLTYPASVDWTTKQATIPMDDNDRYGDCVIAMLAHLIGMWTSLTGAEFDPSVADVDAFYFALTGGQDVGTSLLAAFRRWHRKGLSGHRIGAYGVLNTGDVDEAKWAINEFTGIACAFALPISAQTQTVWDVPAGGPVGDGAPGSWGNHGVPIGAYGGLLTCETWGTKVQMTEAFYRTYNIESRAAISADYLLSGVSPAGFDRRRLVIDLMEL